MKKLLSISTGAAIFLTFTFQSLAATFYDVDETQKYYEAIEFLANIDIVQGHPDGSYKPDDVLNRAEMIKIIAEGIAKRDSWPKNTFDDYKNKSCFKDIKVGQWYTKYVCYGKEQGWVVGYENGKYFKPTQKVSFVEALKITFKGFGASYDESPDPWFLDLVNIASSQNFIPYDVTGFNKGLRRDQMADMITRMIKSEESADALNTYLGNRADIVVTYESLQQGLNLSELKIETKTVE